MTKVRISAAAAIYVSFLWHMHQPYYKDPSTGRYTLPWVRLHGTKDYLDMLEILKDFPAIRQTFNLVPSLVGTAQRLYRKRRKRLPS